MKELYGEPVTITIEGVKGEAGTLEVYKVLKTLKVVRRVDELERKLEKGKAIVRVTSRRIIREYTPPQTTEESSYPIDEGNRLVLTETPDGIDVEIVEDLRPSSRAYVRNLAKLIQNLTGNKSKPAPEYIKDSKLNDRLKVTMHVPTADEETCKQSLEQLKRNLSLTLARKLTIIERDSMAGALSVLEDVCHYNREQRAPRKLRISRERVKLAYFTRDLQKKAELAYFTRELFGVLNAKIRTENHPYGVSVSEILSNKKPPDVVMAKAVGMYVMRKALPELGTIEIGRRFGHPKHSKNHTTIILATKEKGGKRQFDPDEGRIKPSDYSTRSNGSLKYSVEELVEDALEKYKSAHPERLRVLMAPLELKKLRELTDFTEKLLRVLNIKIRTENHPDGVPASEILSKKRQPDVAMARAVGMYVLRKALGLSCEEIGRRFGRHGQPKNSVVGYTREEGEKRQFNPDAGRIKPSDYSARSNGSNNGDNGILKYSVEKLVEDALEKYKAAHPERLRVLMEPLDLKKLQELTGMDSLTRELLEILSTKIRTENYPNGIPAFEILSDKRSEYVRMARAIGMYVLRKARGLTYNEIGRRFGYPEKPKSRPTVISAIKEEGEKRQFNPDVGINPLDYSARNNGSLKYSLGELVDDAREKYESAQPERARSLISS